VNIGGVMKMNWIDHKTYLEILPPIEFNFEECLRFLSRSDQEVLHRISDGYLYKLIKVKAELVLCKIGRSQDRIVVDFPISPPPITSHEEVAAYMGEWFDLDQDLPGFYEMARQDRILQPLVDKYHGLRILCMPDLFEALSWAIMGQQINLTFAYTLKKRFVEKYGEGLTFEGETYWLFPSFEKIATIDVEELRDLQFTSRKAEYIIGVAKELANGNLNKDVLLQQDYQQVKKTLMALRGIGEWTADYVMMKCLQYSCAFPIADVGLHNALKQQLGLARKPTVEEINQIAEKWLGWEAYATFYLWRSLL
jgi:DNA-3-methyladenine glycosylase II